MDATSGAIVVTMPTGVGTEAKVVTFRRTDLVVANGVIIGPGNWRLGPGDIITIARVEGTWVPIWERRVGLFDHTNTGSPFVLTPGEKRINLIASTTLHLPTSINAELLGQEYIAQMVASSGTATVLADGGGALLNGADPGAITLNPYDGKRISTDGTDWYAFG